MKLTRWLLLCLAFVGPLAAANPISAQPATPAASPVAASNLTGLSSYEIDATLDPNGAIAGIERVHYVNSTGAALPDIAFRLYPNAAYYGDGSLTVSSVVVDGRTVKPAYLVAETVMVVTLAKKLKPNAAADVNIAFTTVVPVNTTASYGILTRHSDTGDWILSDWNPIVAGRDAHGWRMDAPGDGGDPTFSDAAFYTAKITAPSSLTIVASGGDSKAATSSSTTVWTVARTPLREFTFIASPTMRRFDRPVGGHVVSAYLHPAENQTAIAKLVLDAATAALKTYEPLFGAYPYHELDVIDAPLAGALGISWTGLLFINGGLLFSSAEANSDRLQFTIAHEISHQWWGALVGSNTNDHAFLAEGMANCSAVLFFLKSQGLDAAATQLDAQIARPYLAALKGAGDGVVDRSSAATPPGPSLAVLIYGKAALGFLAMRETLGPAAFSAALRAYTNDFGWSVSQPADLRAAFQAQTQDDIGPLWRHWFNSTDVTAADVQAVVAGLA